LTESGFAEAEAGKLAKEFDENELNENDVKSLSHEVLKSMGISKAKDRMKILDNVKKVTAVPAAASAASSKDSAKDSKESKENQKEEKDKPAESDANATKCRKADTNCAVVKLGSLVKEDVELMTGDLTKCSKCEFILVCPPLCLRNI